MQMLAWISPAPYLSLSELLSNQVRTSLAWCISSPGNGEVCFYHIMVDDRDGWRNAIKCPYPRSGELEGGSPLPSPPGLRGLGPSLGHVRDEDMDLPASRFYKLPVWILQHWLRTVRWFPGLWLVSAFPPVWNLPGPGRYKC